VASLEVDNLEVIEIKGNTIFEEDFTKAVEMIFVLQGAISFYGK
jgi:hypothetical protein